MQNGFSYVGLSRLSRGQQAAEVGLPSMARQLWQDSLQQPPLTVRWGTPVTMCMSSRPCRNSVTATSVWQSAYIPNYSSADAQSDAGAYY